MMLHHQQYRPSTTSIMRISMATAGKGDSDIMRINATNTIIIIRCPSEDSPSGVGK